MSGRFFTLAAVIILGICRGPARAVTAQNGTTSNAAAVPAGAVKAADPVDPALEAAQALVGRALFLRGFYGGGELTYDATGHVEGQPRQLDWTLAGANIEKVTRRGVGELEFDGVRVAIRYNADQHIFERHPQKDQRLKIVLAVNAEARGLQGALATIFAVGIDPALQRSMPAYWRHHFAPGMTWPNDELTGALVLASTTPAGNGVEFPVLEKKLEPEFTSEARQDHVKGVVQLRLTVGTDGVPRRIWIKQPLGYGLDERAVGTAARFRFHPGTKDGKPVSVEMVVNQTFDYTPPAGGGGSSR